MAKKQVQSNKIAVLMDSFKGSLTSAEAGAAVKEGIRRADASAEVIVRPFADGGEGTLDAFLFAGGRREPVYVSDPLGRRIEASYGILADGSCVIESANAIGLYLLDETERNPLYTSDRGLGEIIAAAIKNGVRNFIIGIGGSSTNDCGIGMLQALGFAVNDENGHPVLPGARGLRDAASISAENVLPELSECSFLVACDVQNPLCGENGCSMVYGPQKGASESECRMMDRWMRHFTEVVKTSSFASDPDAKGAGAAGGLGYAIMTFLSGEMRSGADILFEKIRADEWISSCDLVITGEGRIDGQTAMGKAPVKVAALAKKHQKRVVAFGGCVGPGAESCHEMGIDVIEEVIKPNMSLADAMKKEVAYANLSDAAERMIRTMEEHAAKSYRFYGWETADIKDAKGRTPGDYYDLLSNLWTVETCAPRLREGWSTENRTLGQCSITAFLMQDIFGGKVRGILRSGGNYHCFNDVDGCVFDLTSEQFGDEILDYSDCPEQFREVHFQKEEKRRRYELLKERLEEVL